MDETRFRIAIDLFDQANAEDPNAEIVDGVAQPRELVYARRMTTRLERFAPDASEPLRLAVRGQHIRRWTTPRSAYPPGRAGYHAWRRSLAAFHAETAGALLAEAGYDRQTVRRVRALVQKEGLATDAETQTLEDVACLVFLEHYAADFAARHDEAKCVGVLRKTWRKMSERAHAFALSGKVRLPEPLLPLIQKAVAT